MATVKFGAEFRIQYNILSNSTWRQDEFRALQKLIEVFEKPNGIVLAILAEKPSGSYRRPISHLLNEGQFYGHLFYLVNREEDSIEIISFRFEIGSD
ncbi:MAG: hypothetical protein LCH41_02375 [Armatimonadetes bacterium]|nr:hypothetical protein [Armatimonadota bacterium]